LPDSAANGSWPLQPEPTSAAGAAGAPRPPRIEPSPEEPAAWPLQPHAETPARAQRDTLAALADELSARPVAPRGRPPAATRPHPVEQRLEARPDLRIPPVQLEVAEPAAGADQSLAEMAHRLEAALRKPSARADGRDAREGRAAAAPRATAPDEHAPPAEAAPPPQPPAPLPAPPARAARMAETKPPRADAKQPNPGKMLYDSLEQEMASLLGRPTSKT